MNLLRSSAVRYLIRKLRLPADEENVQSTVASIRGGTEFSGPSVWILVAAIFIASLGLNMNSPAVIIGAMLISPLMGPISGFGLGLGINDILLVKKAVRNFAIMVGVSVLTSTVYFAISPVKEAGSELLARTSPTVYDVLIAFVGGVAGIVAGASKLRKSNVVPGVAIATALMPPLCTIGFGLSNFNWSYVIGAFYLFMINSVLIAISTFLVVTLLGYPKVTEREKNKQKRITWIISALILFTIAPSIYLTFHIIKKSVFQQQATRFVREEIQDRTHIVVTSQLLYKPSGSKLEVVLMGDVIDSSGIQSLEKKLRYYGLQGCQLHLYQGPDAQAAARTMFDDLNQDVQLQSLSIKDIYVKMDSLQRALRSDYRSDSLQQQLAKEMYALDSSLKEISIQPERVFSPATNRYDTVWSITASFAKPVSAAEQRRRLAWLQQRLKSATIRFTTY
ncbi:DUF389 domain-containing protein [Terrimonas ferruginea]|uniref:DUF389 domain-containing protein n=1 Tax=Terrimonas ferruginea TaxID=249 RepID=UPI0003F524B3|nr:DUF389 domain-containing protein [Terrimonas ferruginea]